MIELLNILNATAVKVDTSHNLNVLWKHYGSIASRNPGHWKGSKHWKNVPKFRKDYWRAVTAPLSRGGGVWVNEVYVKFYLDFLFTYNINKSKCPKTAKNPALFKRPVMPTV